MNKTSCYIVYNGCYQKAGYRKGCQNPENRTERVFDLKQDLWIRTEI